MNRGYQFIVNLLTLTVIAFIIYLVYRLNAAFDLSQIVWTNTLDINVVVIALTLLISAFVVRSIMSRGNKSNPLNRIERGATYKRFVDYFYTGIPLDDGWHDLTAHMTLWAPDTVLKKYLQLVQMLEEKKDKSTIERKAEQVIFEIRRDWGFTNFNIIPGEIVKTSKRFERYAGDDLPTNSNKEKPMSSLNENEIQRDELKQEDKLEYQDAYRNGHRN